MRSKLYDKKLISLFLITTAVLCVCCLAMNSYLSGHVKTVSTDSVSQGEIIIEKSNPEKFITDDGFEYYVLSKDDETVVIITKYSGREKQVIVPEKIEGNNVVSIGDSAFCYCDKIESIEIPEGITSIGICAFGGCKKMKKIVIYGEKTEIKYNCFVDCSEELVIYCKSNSEAEKYAKENSIDYKAIV